MVRVDGVQSKFLIAVLLCLSLGSIDAPAQQYAQGLVKMSWYINHGSMFARDVNRDGLTDLIVGVMQGQQDISYIRMQVEVYFDKQPGVLDIEHPLVIAFPQTKIFEMGAMAMGDFTGDGLDDIFVRSQRNAVAMIPGCATCPYSIDTVPAWQLEVSPIASYDAEFGRFITIGDLNCDGIDDLVVASPREQLGWADEPWIGRLHIYFGGSAEKPARADVLAVWREKRGVDLWSMFGSLGVVIADVNGDGCGDLIVGCEQRKRQQLLQVHFGRPSFTVDALAPDQQFGEEDIAPYKLGFWSGIHVFDANNDGKADLFVGALEAYHFYLGTDTGFSVSKPLVRQMPGPDRPGQEHAAVAPGYRVGDMNGDEWDDFLLMHSIRMAGELAFYPGDAGGIRPWHTYTIWNPEPDPHMDNFGDSGVWLGDVTGDGIGDFATSWSHAVRGGFVVYQGWRRSLSEIPPATLHTSDACTIRAYPHPFHEQTTLDVRGLSDGGGTLVICNTVGQEVFRSAVAADAHGSVRVVWDGRDLRGMAVPTGIYHLQLHTRSSTQHARIVRF